VWTTIVTAPVLLTGLVVASPRLFQALTSVQEQSCRRSQMLAVMGGALAAHARKLLATTRGVFSQPAASG
jgi:flagellar biosynthesis protein FliQ